MCSKIMNQVANCLEHTDKVIFISPFHANWKMKHEKMPPRLHTQNLLDWGNKRGPYFPGSRADRPVRWGSWSWSRGWAGSVPSWLPTPRGSNPAKCCSCRLHPDRGPGPDASRAPLLPVGREQRRSQCWEFLSADKANKSQNWLNTDKRLAQLCDTWGYAGDLPM